MTDGHDASGNGLEKPDDNEDPDRATLVYLKGKPETEGREADPDVSFEGPPHPDFTNGESDRLSKDARPTRNATPRAMGAVSGPAPADERRPPVVTVPPGTNREFPPRAPQGEEPSVAMRVSGTPPISSLAPTALPQRHIPTLPAARDRKPPRPPWIHFLAALAGVGSAYALWTAALWEPGEVVVIPNPTNDPWRLVDHAVAAKQSTAIPTANASVAPAPSASGNISVKPRTQLLASERDVEYVFKGDPNASLPKKNHPSVRRATPVPREAVPVNAPGTHARRVTPEEVSAFLEDLSAGKWTGTSLSRPAQQVFTDILRDSEPHNPAYGWKYRRDTPTKKMRDDAVAALRKIGDDYLADLIANAKPEVTSPVPVSDP